MRGLVFLSLKRLVYDRPRTVILVLCLSVPIFLPLASRRLVAGYERDLVARAASTPLLAGAKGSRFDLVLGALYFRANDLGPIPWSEYVALSASCEGTSVPLHARFTAQGFPLVGTTPEYRELRGLSPAAGTWPLILGEAALGATVARELDLGPGDALFSDPRELYDITRPPALKLHVSGVLAPSGTADDEAVFVDVKTAWILEGLMHGHDPAEEVDASLVLGRTQGGVALSGALIEYNEVTPENLAGFHMHATPEELPLSAVLVVPRDEKERSLVKARVNASAQWQAASTLAQASSRARMRNTKPRSSSTTALGLAASTLAMTALVLLLSARLRAPEMRTLERLGAARGTVLLLYTLEMALISAASVALALFALLAARFLLPGLYGALR